MLLQLSRRTPGAVGTREPFKRRFNSHRHATVARGAFGLLTGGFAALALQYHINRREETTVVHCDAAGDFIKDVKRRASEELGKLEAIKAKERLNSLMPDWSSLGERIKDVVVPGWAFLVPGYIVKLQRELSGAPGSLVHEIWQEAHDPEINPEILMDATVRLSTELCDEEKTFLQKRKLHTRKALAKYLNIHERDIHPDDVPTIAMCGSGGGLRALVAGTSSYHSAQQAGLFDCVTYTAGVSGSCWLQTLFYSSLTGQRHENLLSHLKDRLHIHIAFPPPVLSMLTSAPTDKFLLSGGFEKWRGEDKADFGLVDVYGLLLGARLLVPKNDLGVNALDLKLSNQRRFLDQGDYPLPIYTAVRHEIPVEEKKKQIKGSLQDKESEVVKAQAKEEAKQAAWFQWFEFTPYELSCEEIGASIPTWSIGRQFNAGRTVFRESGLSLPEIRVPLLMGIWGSAFCATLQLYYKEIRPILSGLAGFGAMDTLIAGRKDDLVKVHPFEPAQIPNFVLGLRGSLPESTPESLHTSDSIQLMDAGMDCNLPIYPLLRQGRDVDIIIAFDASADIRRENWLRVAEGYALQRGIRGWPIGSGWPDEEEEKVSKDSQAASSKAKEVHNSLEENVMRETHESKPSASGGTIPKEEIRPKDLGYCTIWVGSVEERTTTHPPPSSRRIDDEDFELADGSSSGIAVVYFPLLPNPLVPGVHPDKSEFLSTWNFVYTPEQIDQVAALAKSNFQAGQDRVKALVRAMWQRKKALREERERQRDERWSNLS